MPGACCPGKTDTRILSIGGQQIGIVRLDEIVEEALQMKDAGSQELKTPLIN